MPLLARVATLIKANLNDVLDKAEDPEKLAKQLLLDMQNQYLQLKTQLAMSIADLHLLEQKLRGSIAEHQTWLTRAQEAVGRGEESLARTAIEQALTAETAMRNFGEQVEDQRQQVELVRNSLHRLEAKTAETKMRSELLIAQHRRAKLAGQTAMSNVPAIGDDGTLARLEANVAQEKASAAGRLQAENLLAVTEHFESAERNAQVERLLAELKADTGKTRASTALTRNAQSEPA